MGSKLKAQSYPQITQITQIFKFKTKKLGGSKAGILFAFALIPGSLLRGASLATDPHKRTRTHNLKVQGSKKGYQAGKQKQACGS
jgi:hypothetical protein